MAAPALPAPAPVALAVAAARPPPGCLVARCTIAVAAAGGAFRAVPGKDGLEILLRSAQQRKTLATFTCD